MAKFFGERAGFYVGVGCWDLGDGTGIGLCAWRGMRGACITERVAVFVVVIVWLKRSLKGVGLRRDFRRVLSWASLEGSAGVVYAEGILKLL